MAEANAPIDCPDGHKDAIRMLSVFASVNAGGSAKSAPAPAPRPAPAPAPRPAPPPPAPTPTERELASRFGEAVEDEWSEVGPKKSRGKR
jgi:hypothetical protein